MDNNITIGGSPASRTRSANKKNPSAHVIGIDMEMVPVDLEGTLLAVAADPGVMLPKRTPLCQADYFNMDEGEPPGSGGGSDFVEPVIVPPNSQVHEPNAVSPTHGGDDNDEGLEAVALPPKDLTSEEIEARHTTVSVLKEKPKLRAPPTALKRKWSEAQERVWYAVKLAIRKERRRIYQVSERKRKAATMSKKALPGHEEEPEFVAASGSRARAPPPSQPAFSANERARLVHCLATDEFRPYIEVMVKGTQLRVDMDDKVGRVQPFRELATIFNDWTMDFTNYF